MIKRLDTKMEYVEISVLGNKKAEYLDFEAGRKLNLKINELVNAVNTIQKEREAERFEIQEWIGILEAVRKSVNIHEKQIDELQMKAEPEKATISKMEKVEPADPYAENTQDENPRCPFCGEELSYAQEIDGGFEILTCDCPHGIWFFGNDKMWYNLEKVITELDRTRKALEIAVDALTRIIHDETIIHGSTMMQVSQKALDQITAEQKE